LRFLFEGAPQVTEKVVDSQKAVDNKIKITCELFIAQTTQHLSYPLVNVLNLAKTLEPTKQLRSHQAFTPENLSKSIEESFNHLMNELSSVKRRMSLYLSNRDTEAILFRPVKMDIQSKYDELKRIIQCNYSEDEQKVVSLPSLEQFNL